MYLAALVSCRKQKKKKKKVIVVAQSNITPNRCTSPNNMKLPKKIDFNKEEEFKRSHPIISVCPVIIKFEHVICSLGRLLMPVIQARPQVLLVLDPTISI
jgi:hypothetical protein